VYDRPVLDDAALLALVQGIAPDVAFASGWVDKGYLKACRALRTKGIPTVMCSDTAWRGDARQWAAVATARLWLPGTFSHAWVTGEAQSTYATRLGFPAAHIGRGFYSADVERFSGMAARLDKGPLPHRFLCVARYIPTKGHQLLCDAFAELCDAGGAGDHELWIAGTGEMHAQVTTSPSGRHQRIRHLGFVQAEDMPEVMRQCGIFVLPSTHEPWGVVVHEHACAGFPLVLSSAVGASERFLREGRNGITFRSGDGADLRRALAAMIAWSDAERLRMGAASHTLGMAWGPHQWAAAAMRFIPTGHG
jgi:glycosyltransferase involved in cell wall biosynthesis